MALVIVGVGGYLHYTNVNKFLKKIFFSETSNTFCKELYTFMCNITKKLSFLVKILQNATHNKDLKYIYL